MIFDSFTMGEALLKPSFTHILGTDNLGRDILSRLILGTGNTLLIVLVAIIIGTVIGTIIGGVSGYYSGVIDHIIQSIVEIILSIPAILIAICIVVLMGAGYDSIITAICIMYLPLIINYSRGLVIQEKNKDYITAAKTYGVKDFRIIVRHIFPNIKKYILLNFVINFANAMLTEAGLGFLGIGIDPSIPTLGNMLNNSFTYAISAPWFSLAPATTLFILVYFANEFSRRKGKKVGKKIKN